MPRRTFIVLGLIGLVVASVGFGIALQRRAQSLEALRAFQTEADAIADILQLAPGAIVADIWAGDGRWSVDLARRLAPDGHVYVVAGPDDPVEDIYRNVSAAQLDNLTILSAEPGHALGWLQADCCDALLVRAVYHDLPDRVAVTRQLFDEIRAGGRLALIDFAPGSPQGLSGHGIDEAVAMQEVTGVGFEMTRTIRDWTDLSYCLVFEKPATVDSPPAETPPPVSPGT